MGSRHDTNSGPLGRLQPEAAGSVERAVACDTERDRSWMWEATRVEQGTEQRDAQQSSNEVSLLCTSSGIQAAGTDKREEAQEVKRGKGKGELTYPGGKVWLICPRSSSMTHAIGMTMIARPRKECVLPNVSMYLRSDGFKFLPCDACCISDNLSPSG